MQGVGAAVRARVSTARRRGPVGRAYYEHAVAVSDVGVRLVEATESGHFDMIVPSTSSWPIVVDALRSLFEEFARPNDLLPQPMESG